jgi:hypothetical protein
VSARAPHVLVATPVAGGVVAHEYLHSVLNLQKHFDALGWSMEVVTRPDGLVTRSRNGFASVVARHEKYSHLLMLDADVTVAPEGIERIVRSGHDFVGCVVPFREINWEQVRLHLDVRPEATAQELRTMSPQYALWYEPKQKAVNGFIPVQAIGSAVMLISRSALLTITASDRVSYASQGLPAVDGNKDGWTFFDPFIDSDGVYLSEDYALCNRWRSLGGTVWADLRTPTQHIGPVRIAGDIAASLRAATEYTRISKERSVDSE